MSLCFLAVALGIGYWSLLRAPRLVVRDDNPRLIEAERRIRRGDIYDRHGRPLARSEPAPNGAWQRVYPVPGIAPVVGYFTIDHGTGGIEKAYDAQIKGQRPRTPLEQFGAELLHLYPAGVGVTLTLDLDVQLAAYNALGDRTGAVVVLDTRNGDLLALVSKPTFDPNTLEADWPRLQSSPAKPMLNRATQGLYSPGLVFETITLAAAMEEGLAEPSTVFTDRLGVLLAVDPPVSCPSPPPKPNFTLVEAYTWPCSVVFAGLGLELGGERLADYAVRMGIGIPVELPIETLNGQMLERGVWSDLLAARTAIGEGEVLVTPLEMLLATATLVNDGARPVPRLVLQVGSERTTFSPPRPVLSADTARQVREAMVQAFDVGRTKAHLPETEVAGRAGSAESGQPGAPPHAWFIGFAPREHPRYAIVVIVEHGGDGWAVAAPVAIDTLSGQR